MLVFIIRQKHIPFSLSLSVQAESSVLRHKLDPHFFEGLDSLEAIELMEKDKIKKSADATLDWTAGTIGCLGSHYSLWKKCVELNVPIVIMEHDGIMVKDPTPLVEDVKDVCHLDHFLPFNSRYSDTSNQYRDEYEANIKRSLKNEGVSKYPTYSFYGDTRITGGCFVGAYGYLLMPEGATKLINFIKEFGAYPADKSICERAALLQGSNATYVKLNSFFDTIEKQRRYTTRN